MLHLSDVLADRSLMLSSLVEAGDPKVGWAHVSELVDPTPWLTGGELLLTTGLELFGADFDCEEYCRRLASRGVAALGVSSGSSLPHPSPPAALIEAAAAVGFSLVHVPERTPLQSVVRWVSQALHEQENLPLRQALVAQRQLSEAATAEDGVQAVLGVLQKANGFSAVVTDPSLRPIAASGAISAPLLDRLRAEARRRISGGLRWSVAAEDADEEGTISSFISPLGTRGELRGVIIAAKRGSTSTYDRALMTMVFSHLSVLLQLRHAASFHEREQRSAAVRDLLFGELGEVEATLRLARAGVRARTLLVLACSRSLTETEQTLLTAALEPECADVLFHDDPAGQLVVVADPGTGVVEAVTGAAADDIRVGIGKAVAIADVQSSLRQARRALGIAASRGERVFALPDYEGYRALLALGTEAERAAFGEEVLGPLDRHDSDGRLQLLDALRHYLRLSGNMEDAAKALGIHRHTLRSRMALVSELTGRNLATPDDRFELWLAVEMRDLADAAADGDGEPGTMPRA